MNVWGRNILCPLVLVLLNNSLNRFCNYCPDWDLLWSWCLVVAPICVTIVEDGVWWSDHFCVAVITITMYPLIEGWIIVGSRSWRCRSWPYISCVVLKKSLIEKVVNAFPILYCPLDITSNISLNPFPTCKSLNGFWISSHWAKSRRLSHTLATRHQHKRHSCC
jgi:hypothetical protein